VNLRCGSGSAAAIFVPKQAFFDVNHPPVQSFFASRPAVDNVSYHWFGLVWAILSSWVAISHKLWMMNYISIMNIIKINFWAEYGFAP
jgi:hypothetical protein